MNLETAIGRKKDAYGIGVPGEIKKFVVTVLVMRHFLILRGAPRACVDFCDPTAVSRLNVEKRTQTGFRQVDEQEKDSPK